MMFDKIVRKYATDKINPEKISDNILQNFSLFFNIFFTLFFPI